MPVYSAFHTQLDVHFWFNHTLRNEIGKKKKICEFVTLNYDLFFGATLTMMVDVSKLSVLLLLLLWICSLPNHQPEWNLNSERCSYKPLVTP